MGLNPRQAVCLLSGFSLTLGQFDSKSGQQSPFDTKSKYRHESRVDQKLQTMYVLVKISYLGPKIIFSPQFAPYLQQYRQNRIDMCPQDEEDDKNHKFPNNSLSELNPSWQYLGSNSPLINISRML